MKIYEITYYSIYRNETKIYFKKYFENKEHALDYYEYLELECDGSTTRVAWKEIEIISFEDVFFEIEADFEELKTRRREMGEYEEKMAKKHPFMKKYDDSGNYKIEFLEKLDYLVKKYSPSNFSI